MTDDAAEILGGGGQVDQQRLFELYEQQGRRASERTVDEDDENDNDEPISVRFVLSRDLNKRLDRYLVDRIPFLSRTSLQELITNEAVEVNGRLPKPSTKLRKGDEVFVVLPPPPSTVIIPEDIPINVIYEDDHLILINKHPGIIVHPARAHKSGTLVNALAWHFQHRSSGELSSVGEEFARPGVVHRLDRHTSGVMVAAKTDTAHWRLCRQFEKRTTAKRYLAIVHGRMETLADRIDMPIGKHMTQKEKYAVRFDATAKDALTIYRVREVFDQFTLVEVEIKTGRTHQIRVHLSHLGYPIAGDDMYGGRIVLLSDIVSELEGKTKRTLKGTVDRVASDAIERERHDTIVPSAPPAGRKPRGWKKRGAKLPDQRQTIRPLSLSGDEEQNDINTKSASANLPMVNDDTTDRVSDIDMSDPNRVVLDRQALHAAYLSFTHPVSEDRVEWQAPLPPDLQQFLMLLREHQHPERVNVPGTILDI